LIGEKAPEFEKFNCKLLGLSVRCLDWFLCLKKRPK